MVKQAVFDSVSMPARKTGRYFEIPENVIIDQIVVAPHSEALIPDAANRHVTASGKVGKGAVLKSHMARIRGNDRAAEKMDAVNCDMTHGISFQRTGHRLSPDVASLGRLPVLAPYANDTRSFIVIPLPGHIQRIAVLDLEPAFSVAVIGIRNRVIDQ